MIRFLKNTNWFSHIAKFCWLHFDAYLIVCQRVISPRAINITNIIIEINESNIFILQQIFSCLLIHFYHRNLVFSGWAVCIRQFIKKFTTSSCMGCMSKSNKAMNDRRLNNKRLDNRPMDSHRNSHDRLIQIPLNRLLPHHPSAFQHFLVLLTLYFSVELQALVLGMALGMVLEWLMRGQWCW